MGPLSVAVGFTSGELASEVIASIDNHPFLDLCGVARSIPDLLRLLERFHPSALVMSHLLLEELDVSELEGAQARALSVPVSFLISYPGMRWDEVELAGMLRLPFRFAGLIPADESRGVDLFREIKDKLEIYNREHALSVSAPGREERHGDANGLYTVMGTKGGVGTTLLACSLAAAMSSAGRRVLLMEMDSMLSQLLYLKPRGEGKSLLDLLPLAEEISWDLIRVSVHRHASGFHLLPYGERNESSAARETPIPEPLLRNLLFLFDVIVQDLPYSSRGDFLPLLYYCPKVLLVSLPDSLSATCARTTAAYLHRTGLDHGHLHLVVNRCGPYHALNPDELARAVGMELLAALPDDPRSGLDFAELGELPQQDSPLGKAAAVMAAALGFGDMPPAKATALQFFKRLRGHPTAAT